MEWYTILLIVVGVINFMVMMGLFGKHEKLDEIQEALLDHKKQIKQLRMELELSDQIRGTNEGTFKEQIDDLTLRIDNYSSYIAGIEKALSDRIEELDNNSVEAVQTELDGFYEAIEDMNIKIKNMESSILFDEKMLDRISEKQGKQIEEIEHRLSSIENSGTK